MNRGAAYPVAVPFASSRPVNKRGWNAGFPEFHQMTVPDLQGRAAVQLTAGDQS